MCRRGKFGKINLLISGFKNTENADSTNLQASPLEIQKEADPKVQSFLAHFEEKTLPAQFNGIDYKNFSKNRVQAEYLPYLVGDTTGKMIAAEDGLHFSTDYFYKYRIKGNGNFDLIILGEYPYPAPQTSYDYYLFSISPVTGELLGKILFFTDHVEPPDLKTNSLAQIDENFNIHVQIIDSIIEYSTETDINPLNVRTSNKNYSVDEQGRLHLKDSVIEEKKLMISQDGKVLDTPLALILGKYWANDYYFLDSVITQFNKCQSAKDLEYVFKNQYRFLLALNKVLERFEADSFPAQDSLNRYIPFISIGYGAEGCCTEADPRYYPMYEKALQTPEKDDDILFDAFSSVYNIDKEYKIFAYNKFIVYESMEDVYSKAGENEFIKAFAAIQSARQKTNMFQEQFQMLFDRVFSDLIQYEYFIHSKDEVLQELEQIATEISMDNASKQILENYIERVKQLPENAFNHKVF